MCCIMLGPFLGQVFAESELSVYFLDVGQADSILVECGGQYMLIDGGNVDDSQLVFSFLRNTIGTDHLDYVVSSHPHEDHVGGLAAALNACSVGKIYSPVTDYDSEAFQSMAKYAQKQGLALTQPLPGETVQIGDAMAQFLVTGKDYNNINDLSIVVKVTLGQTSFLFTGDAEWELEHDLVDCGYDLSAAVLKVGHHGSDTSSSYVFLREVMPQYAVISVGADNSYGHPNDTTLSRLRDVGAQVFRTDLQGNILFRTTGDGAVSVQTQRESDDEALFRGADLYTYEEPTSVPALPSSDQGGAPYIGNKNSKKFHYAYCPSVEDMKEKNKVEFQSRDEAISQGYVPCKNCNP